jgi:hypothetical protein
MGDVVSVRKIEPLIDLEILECLDKLGFLFLVVRRCVPYVTGPCLEERLNHEVCHLIDLVAADSRYLGFLCDENNVVPFKELNESQDAVGISNHHIDALDLADVVVKLVSIEDSRLLLHDVPQRHGAVCVRLLKKLHGKQLTLHLV